MAKRYAYGRPNEAESPHSSRWSPAKTDHPIPPGAAWGQIFEVPLAHKPVYRQAGETVPRGLWLALFRELMLRLEQTRTRKLGIPFPTVELARRAYQTLYHHASLRGIKVHIERSYGEDPPVLYIYRGHGWSTPDPGLFESSTSHRAFNLNQETL